MNITVFVEKLRRVRRVNTLPLKTSDARGPAPSPSIRGSRVDDFASSRPKARLDNWLLPLDRNGNINSRKTLCSQLCSCDLRAEWQLLASKMPQHYSERDHLDPPSFLNRLAAVLPGGLAAQAQRFWDRQSYGSVSPHASKIPRSLRNARRWNLKRLLNLPHLFVAIWALLLFWGERWVFQSAVQACGWRKWEKWVGYCLTAIGWKEADVDSLKKQRRTIWSLSQIRNSLILTAILTDFGLPKSSRSCMLTIISSALISRSRRTYTQTRYSS